MKAQSTASQPKRVPRGLNDEAGAKIDARGIFSFAYAMALLLMEDVRGVVRYRIRSQFTTISR